MVQEKWVTIKGRRLYTKTAGSAGPVLLFLHGFTLDSDVWDAQLRYFSDRYRVVACDLLGFGRSDSPDAEPYSHRDCLMQLLDELSDELGQKPVHWIGMSMSGGVALDVALEHPDRVASLTLVGAISQGQQWSAAWIDLMKHVAQVAREEGVDAAKQLWQQAPVFAYLKEKPAALAQLSTMLARYSGWHWLHRDLNVPADPPAFSRLNQLQGPIIAITGENDLVDFTVTADAIVDQVSSCRRVVIPQAGHLPALEQPDLFNSLLENFLQTVLNKQADEQVDNR